MATEIKVLSAGAVKPGLTRVIDRFRREIRNDVGVVFATAPEIRKRLAAGEAADVVIAPPAVLDDLVTSAEAQATDRVLLGRIGIGVMVRDGTTLPKIDTVNEFKLSLLDADAVVYNQASTGIYLAKLFEGLGVSEQLKSRSTVYPDFAQVLQHLSKGSGKEIGFGATTVIIESESKGIKFVGPLPAEIQNYTTYIATVVPGSTATDRTKQLIRYFSTDGAKNLFRAAGIE
jgi:molybdate transport system substrate-binding protein